MTLESQIEETDIFSILGYEDARIIETAERVMDTAPNGFFSGDGIDKGWFEDNIKIQKDLMNLRSRLSYLRNTFELDCKAIRGQNLRLTVYDEFKYKDDKEAVRISEDGEFRDKLISINKLEAALSYVDGVIWVLKDLMKLFKV